MLGTATKVRDEVGGFAGPATLYKVDPPLNGTEHLIVYYQQPMYGQRIGQISVLLATANGAIFTPTMEPQEGTRYTNLPDHARALDDAGYKLVEEESVPSGEQVESSQLYDPSAHTVAKVNDYLDHSDPAEQVRVLEAERNGKARKGILGEDVT